MYAVPESDIPSAVTISSSDTEEYDEGKELFNPPKAKKMTGTTSSTSDALILKNIESKVEEMDRKLAQSFVLPASFQTVLQEFFLQNLSSKTTSFNTYDCFMLSINCWM